MKSRSIIVAKCTAKMVQYFSLEIFYQFTVTEKLVFDSLKYSLVFLVLYWAVGVAVETASTCLQGALHNGILVLSHCHNKKLFILRKNKLLFLFFAISTGYRFQIVLYLFFPFPIFAYYFFVLYTSSLKSV